GRKKRSYEIAQVGDRGVRRLEGGPFVEQLSRYLERCQHNGSARFDYGTARQNSANQRVQIVRDFLRVLRRSVRPDRVLLVRDGGSVCGFFAVHRSPPGACCRRNRTRSSICLARAVASSSRFCSRSFSRSSVATRLDRSSATAPPSWLSTSFSLDSAVSARRRNAASSSARWRTSRSNSATAC